MRCDLITMQQSVHSSPASAARRGHIAGLDGLRAIAVGLVLVYHLFPGVLPGGFLGVDVFFVISGFLITTLLLRERVGTGRIDLVDFWRRRARRLLPAVVLVVLTAGAAAALIGGDPLVGLGRQVLGALTFSYNWVSILFDSSYFEQTSPDLLRNFWSLAVEEQFYIIWPLLFLGLAWLGGRRLLGAASVLFAAGSVLWMLALAPTAGEDATRVYFGTDTHAFGIALGCALACFLFGRSPGRGVGAGAAAVGALGLVSLPVLSIVVDDISAWTYPWGLLAASVGTAGVITAGVLAPSFGRLLDAEPLRWIGVRSYGIYLWHWPLLVLAHELLRGQAPSFVISVFVLTATLLLAQLSFRWIEQPFRRLGFRALGRYTRMAWVGATRKRWRATGASILSVAAAVVLVTGIVQAPSESRAERVISEGQRQLEQTPLPSPEQPEVPTPSADADALDISTDGSDVTAIGDSVMLASVPALQDALPEITIDAAVSRNFDDGLDIAEALAAAGELRSRVVIGLATNAVIDDAQLQRLAALAEDHRLVLITAYGDRSWIPVANEALTSFAAEHPSRVAIADWGAAAAGGDGMLAPDLIHPEPAGATAYTDRVVDALETLTLLERELKPHRPVTPPATGSEDADPASPVPSGLPIPTVPESDSP